MSSPDSFPNRKALLVKRKLIQDQRVLLTGASSGIGHALAELLLERGARVMLNARRREPLVALQQRFPQHVAFVAGSIGEPETRAQLIREVEQQWGGLELLVNNAGIGAMGPFVDAAAQRLDEVLRINFVAAAEMCRAAYPLLKQGQQPAVLNIGSILGHRAVPWKSEYCASKFALRGFTSALRAEWKAAGIDVLHLSPSTTDSPFFESAIEDTMRRNWKGNHAMSPERVAQIALRAWQKGRHDVLLSPGGKTLVWLDRLAPRFTDWLVARWG